jgi:hypothetical protein
VTAADRNAAAIQKVAQHPASGERIFQMQFVDPSHDREVLVPRDNQRENGASIRMRIAVGL